MAEIIFTGEVLSTKRQIEILTLASKKLADNSTGICSAIDDAMHDLGMKQILQIESIIPLFTFENAMIACKEKACKMPDGKKESYWWSSYTYDCRFARICVIDWMLDELKKY